MELARGVRHLKLSKRKCSNIHTLADRRIAMRCPICNTDAPKNPVSDFTTGWTFCGDCYDLTRRMVEDRPVSFNAWLLAIVNLRRISAEPEPPLVRVGQGDFTNDYRG